MRRFMRKRPALSGIPRRLAALLLVTAAAAAGAAPDVRVVALFDGRAMLLVDGKQHLLREGEASPEGVKLLSASSEGAVLEIGGREVQAALDSRVSARKRTAAVREVQVRRDLTGMYSTVGSINGYPVPFLVDTGATQIAMNAAMARRLGIDYRVVGNPIAVTTASGGVRGWHVMLDSVKLGEIELSNVGGVVIEGSQPEVTLLGMSFLGRLEISNSGELMTLRRKY